MTDQPIAQINALTGLRFFAATIVVFFHFASFGSVTLRHFVSHGFIGVTIFFVLSGFILSYTYSSGPGAMRGTKGSFWIARVARLYPVYVIGMGLFLPIVARGDDSVVIKAAAGFLSLMMAQAWLHPLGLVWGMWNPPGWSLSAEAFFYLLFPFVCPMLSKLSKISLVWVAIGCCAVSLAAPIAYFATGSAPLTFWIFPPLFRLPEFVLGMAVGLMWKNRHGVAFDNAAPYAAIASIVVLGLAMCAPLSNEVFYNGATAPLAALLICSLGSGRGVVAALFSWRPIVELGAASYSLYILHWPTWNICQYLFGGLRQALLHPSAFFCFYFCITTAVAWGCHKYVEEPTNRILRKRLMRNSAQNPCVKVEIAGH